VILAGILLKGCAALMKENRPPTTPTYQYTAPAGPSSRELPEALKNVTFTAEEIAAFQKYERDSRAAPHMRPPEKYTVWKLAGSPLTPTAIGRRPSPDTRR
jgi:hypothetical protein